MGPLAALGSVLPIAFAAGINLYLTVLVIGLSLRMEWVTDVPAGFQVLASPVVLIAAGVLYIIEFFADKIPYVDNIWDLIHTFVRPVGAMVVVTAGLTDIGTQTEAIAALLAGAVALTSHGGKAGTRTAVNVASPAENISNILLSLLEDLLVAGLVFLALSYPTAANVLTVGLLLLIVVLLPPLLRWAWFTLGAVFARLRGLVHQVQRPDRVPERFAGLLDSTQPALSIRCRAQDIAGAGGRRGYLLLAGAQVRFVYVRWFREQQWALDTRQISSVRVRPSALATILTIAYADGARPREVRFVATRDRSALLERLVDTLRTHMQQPV